MQRVILHSDMNNFYASVETVFDPSLRDRPIAVGGDPERRHGIVLAKKWTCQGLRRANGRATLAGEAKMPRHSVRTPAL